MWDSVAGLTTGRRRPSVGERHSPSTKSCRSGTVAGEAIGRGEATGYWELVGSWELQLRGFGNGWMVWLVGSARRLLRGEVESDARLLLRRPLPPRAAACAGGGFVCWDVRFVVVAVVHDDMIVCSCHKLSHICGWESKDQRENF